MTQPVDPNLLTIPPITIAGPQLGAAMQAQQAAPPPPSLWQRIGNTVNAVPLALKAAQSPKPPEEKDEELAKKQDEQQRALDKAKADAALAQSENAGAAAGQLPQGWYGGGASQVIPAHEVPLMDPERLQRLSADRSGELQAQQKLGQAEAAEADAQARVPEMEALENRRQADEVMAVAEDERRRTEQILQQRERIAKEVHTLDPERWWKHQDTGDRIRYGIAAFLSGFGQSLTGQGGNAALDNINRHIDRDLQAQKQEIENHKDRIADMDTLLAATYRQTGNWKQSMNIAHSYALKAVQGEANAYAMRYATPKVLAQNDLLQAQTQTHIDEAEAHGYAYVQKQVAGGGVSPAQKYQKYVESELAKGKNRGEILTPQRFAGVVYSGTGLAAPLATAGAGSGRLLNRVAQIEAAKSDLLKAKAILQDKGNWARLSPTDKARVQALVEPARNLGFKAIDENPAGLLSGPMSAQLATIDATVENLGSQQTRLQSGMASGGSAESGEGDAEAGGKAEEGW